MKKLITCLLTFWAFSANAQITLNLAGYNTAYVGTDTLRETAASATFPSIAPATNASWDLTALTYTNTTYNDYFKPYTGSAFPGGQRYDSLYYPIAGMLAYETGIVSSINANGYQNIGEKINRQAIPLVTISGGLNDSLIFLQQDVPYSSPNTDILFPATMGTNWGSDYTFTTNFTLTVLAYALNNVPSQRKTHIIQTDTVVGWGKMKVKGYTGNPSANMNVLMVKSQRMIIDSFFIGGTPAPAMLLQAFGLVQGDTIHIYEYNFYRAGEIVPLARVVYNDDSYSQAQIDYARVHTNRHPDPASVTNITKYGKVAIYPNPLTGNTINLTIQDHNLRTVQYDVMNINGQIVAKGEVNMNSGKGAINIANAPTAGIYYVRLYEGSQLLTTLPLNIN